jgi:hypothetical protein
MRVPTTASPVRYTSPQPEVLDLVDDDYDGETLQFRAVDYDGGRILDDQELHLGSVKEPTTFCEAERDHRWRNTMNEDMSSIKENKTWVLVGPPANYRPIGLKWVFKEKQDEHGNIVMHKARLVAKDYVQRGVHFEEVFAPVMRMESVPLLIAMAAIKDREIHHMDVKSTFLSGELVGEVFVQ